MAEKLNLSRSQLASFLKDFEQIRQFETLFGMVNDIESFRLDDIANVAETSQAAANEALAQLSRIADALEYIATAPRNEPRDRVSMLLDTVTSGAAAGMVLIYDETLGVWEAALLTAGTNIDIAEADGSITISTTSAITASLTDDTTNLIASDATLTDGAGAGAGTLTNAPTAGDPTKWVAIDDNGVTRYLPAW